MPKTHPSILHVEGKDDVHAIGHLLLRHGIDCESIPVSIKHSGDEVDTSGGVNRLLAGMPVDVMASTGRSVGFVLDADEVPGDRWNAVCDRLEQVGMTPPNEIPAAGFVDAARSIKARVGVWLMPDNRRPGALEEFLRDLVRIEDPLLPIADESTHHAKERGARFPDSAQRKAVLHAWLAWQERPGLPYGSAIRAHYFGHDSAAALAFVEWFKRVFTS